MFRYFCTFFSKISVNFTAIDFETAHSYYPCEIGLTRVENGIITNSVSYLIKPPCFPYMNPNNERIHGISSKDLKFAKSFNNLWKEIKPWLEDQYVVAHNAGFDMWVLKSILAHYNLAVPWIDYFCSLQLSQKVWKKQSGHSLKSLCDYYDIRFNQHRAGDDAYACAQITLKAFEEANCVDVERGLADLGLKLKRLKNK